MSFGNNSTNQDALLKNLYNKGNIQTTIEVDHPFHAMLKKREDVDGRYFVYPLHFAAGQGRSADFATALAMASLSGESMVDFLVPLQENSAVANVATKLIAQSKGKDGAFLDIVSLIADKQLMNFGNDLARSEFRTSDGNIGQIGSISGSTVTMLVAADITNISVGMQLDLATSKTATKKAYGSGSHGLYVVKRSVSAGTFDVGTSPVPGGTTCDVTSAVDGIPTALANDYVFVTGDKGVKMNGFQDWIPYGAVASNDSFLNVNRSVDQTSLAGSYLDGTSSATVTSAIQDGIAQVGNVGGKLTHAFMSHSKFMQLSKEVTAQVRLAEVKVSQTIGFEGIEVAGSTGSVICLPDRSCPANTIAGVNIDSWELLSVDPAVHLWDEDGKSWLRSSTQNGMELRFYSFCNMLCTDPRQNINIRVSA